MKPESAEMAEKFRIGLATVTRVFDWLLADRDAMRQHIERMDRRLAELEMQEKSTPADA